MSVPPAPALLVAPGAPYDPADYLCEACQHRIRIPVSAAWPHACPSCGVPNPRLRWVGYAAAQRP